MLKEFNDVIHCLSVLVDTNSLFDKTKLKTLLVVDPEKLVRFEHFFLSCRKFNKKFNYVDCKLKKCKFSTVSWHKMCQIILCNIYLL